MAEIAKETMQRLKNLVKPIPEEPFLDQNQLISKLKQLSKYFNFETIDQLASIVMLEESIFKARDFGEEFGQNPFFWEIARYNIYHHSLQVLKEKSERKFTSSYEAGTFKIFCSTPNGHKIEAFKAILTKSNPFTEEVIRPTIQFYEPYQVEEQLDDYDRRMCTTGVLRNTYATDPKLESEIRAQYNISQTIGGKKEQWEREYQETITQLKNEKKFLEQYGHLEKEVCHEVGDILLKDWNMELDESLDIDGKVKKLSWIDIYQYHKK